MAKRDASNRRYWIVSACLMLAGGALWLAFTVVGANLDAQGNLRDPFALLLIGWMLMAVGIVSSLICTVIALCCKRR
ncbi:DUF3955 domain-containing protein [Pandoraea sp. NPDC090278]|uniref:DUF3955 domain-containing protein n=1 Tax=Pandoraea sp. NPDC090278 TaxID=3364391 RepID=UPI00383A638F